MNKYLLLLLVQITMLAQVLTQQKFTMKALQEDLLLYKTKLEQLHPNLCLYSSKEQINYLFDSLMQSIDTSMTERDFFSKIALTSKYIKDGHTLILPSSELVNNNNARCKFMPLVLGIADQKLYVKMNCSLARTLEDGMVIDSINGLASDVIIKYLLDRQVRDGENISYAKWILDTYFREYYSYFFGHPSIYRIAYHKENKAFQTYIYPLPKDSIHFYKIKYYPSYSRNSILDKGIAYEYLNNNQLCVLKIKDFHDEVLKDEYNQKFEKEIKTIIEKVIDDDISNLVIDLRDNQGGDVENGLFLLKYLIPHSFTLVNDYQKVQNGKLVKGKGPAAGTHKPFKKQFQGQIFVLLNGGSFSNSVIFSSCLKEHTKAIFVGTESGGNPNVLAGYTNDFELPNTKINVQIPTKRFVMTNLSRNNGRGLLPDFVVENRILDIINQRDVQLEYVSNLINQKNR